MLPMMFMALVDESDLPAFEQLYETNKDIMFHRANKILHNKALAEECVSDTFLAIAKNFHNINKLNAEEQRKYIVISIKNRALNIVTRENRLQSEFSFDDAILINSDLNELKEIELKDIISKLNQSDLDILYMVAIQSRSYQEIAESYGISYAAAKQRYWTAKTNLKKLMSKDV